MHAENKKLTVLNELVGSSNPISLADLMKTLGTNYAERTVRRWLSEMVEEGLVEKIGDKRSSKYLAVRKEIEDVTPELDFFSEESLKVIKQVLRPPYERIPVAYNDEWFESYAPNHTYCIPVTHRMRLEQEGKRLRQEDPAGTYAHQIFNRLLVDLSYNSSRLKGNTYSLLDTQKLLLEGMGAEGKLDEEKIMILNHKEAIWYLVDNAARIEVTEQTVYTLHYLLSEGLLESRYSGKIRDQGVRIGGSRYFPFEDRQLEVRFSRILKKASLIKNPYEQSLFLLVHISYLQAFSDVNKRTARLSANIPLIINNLVPLSFNDVKKEDYTSAMIAVYELQDIRPILDLYVFSYIRTCKMYDSTVKAMGFDEVRVRYRQQRRALIREIILNTLTGESLAKYLRKQTFHR